MTISEAAKAGIRRLRRPRWADPVAYVRLDLVGEGNRGPWMNLYDRATQNVCGVSTPQKVFSFESRLISDYVEYTGERDVEDHEA